ncbi:ferritin-like domain-containing protein [Mucilaginibacter arboris]|uniref:Ferritin-like domain-containing protein n=1 Tax=Mucilaginibacter arboris TaxID=2682090 RepID=A0A7K1SYL2_9SPHI|nr:ferritin-like domain-containing protein [Mucilaginibacter arboris]MVN22347.1 ferritin-like domain-containing protein [Mucilaginibacter arboris]
MEIFTKKGDQLLTSPEAEPSQRMQRRQFLRYAGAGTAAVGLLAAEACKKDRNSYTGVYLGSGDIGILNYAYALEQLEAAFYIQVVGNTNFKTIFPSTSEQNLFTDIRDHEVAHREFFKAALGTSAIPALQVNFTSIDFTTRAGVLAASKSFEDLGVSAYNGAGYLIQNPDYLTFAGKIVSVEARHAAYIRDLIAPNSFVGSDVVDIASTGKEMERTPAQVLAIAGTYITTKINADDLPTS